MFKLKIFLFLFVIIQCATFIHSSEPCVFLDCDCQASEGGHDVNCDNELLKQELPKRNEQSNIKLLTLFEANNQEITRLPNDRFNGLSVRLIEIKDGQLKEIDPLAFNGISDLESIDLGLNQIESLDENVFTPVSSTLRQLALPRNTLGSSDVKQLSAALNNAKELVSLNLVANKLKQIPDLRANAKLQELELRSNELTTLTNADDGQSALPESLTMLDLEYNQLKTIESVWFDHLKNLRTLSLRYNQIHAIAEGAFSGLVNLENLVLARNELKNVPQNLISNLQKLKQFDLQDQNANLARLEDFALDRPDQDASGKYAVDLSKNRIDSLDKRAFCKRSNKPLQLTSLNLNGNPLKSLDACVFGNLNQGAATKTRVELGETLKCDCSVQYIAQQVDLHGKCVNSNNVAVLMSDYQCDNQQDFENLCKETANEYKCDGPETTTESPSTPEDGDSNNNNNSGNDDNGSEKPEKPEKSILSTIAPAKPVAGSFSTSLKMNYFITISLLSFYTIIRRFLF